MNQKKIWNRAIVNFVFVGTYTYVLCSDEYVHELIDDELTYFDSKAHFYKGKKNKNKKLYYFDGANKRFPIGLTPKASKVLTDAEYEIRTFQKKKNSYTFDFSDHLDDYQTKALNDFFASSGQHGIMKVATGGGKSVLMDEAIRVVAKNLKSPCIMVVDETEILKNAQKTFKEFSDIEATVWGGGKPVSLTDDLVVLAGIRTIQSYLKPPPTGRRTKGESFIDHRDKKRKLLKAHSEKVEMFVEYIKRFRFIAVDEVQEFGSEGRTKIMHMFGHCEFKMYSSATPFKANDYGSKRNVVGFTNKILVTVTEQQLVDLGRLAKRIAIVIDYTEPPNDWSEYLDRIGKSKATKYDLMYKWYIAQNDRRNKIIVWIMAHLKTLNMSVLTLVQLNNHGEYLARKTGHPFVNGTDDEAYRDEILAKQKSGEIKSVIASNIYNKGVDIPALDVVINAGAGKEQTKWEQKRGRVLRNKVREKQSKTASIDFYDHYSPYFDVHSKGRLNRTLKLMPRDQVHRIKYNDDIIEFSNKLNAVLNDWFGNQQVPPF